LISWLHVTSLKTYLTPFVARYQIPRAYASAEQLWADQDIEAVLIAVADHFHAPLAIAAMQADKHVLIEKPLAQP
jgi:predicted dehydrogenase